MMLRIQDYLWKVVLIWPITLHTRNLGEYEGDLNVDERFVTDLVAAVQTVALAIQQLALS